MAVITFVIGYRSGAASGSPVASYYLADTFAELGPSPVGDLAFCKDVQAFFMATSAGWKYIYNGGGIYGDVIIAKAQPRLVLQTSSTRHTRFFAPLEGFADMSVNYNYTGTGWVKDDGASAGARFFLTAAGGIEYQADNLLPKFKVSPNGDISKIGNTYEYGRTAPSDIWTDIPFASGNFGAQGGIGAFNATATQVFAYKLDGKSLKMNFWIEGVASGGCTGVNFYLPLGLTATRTAMNGAWVYDPGTGPSAGIVYTYSTLSYASIQKATQSAFTAGVGLILAGQLEIPIP